MGVLMFDAFKVRDLQNCIALLNIVEEAGVTDIRVARQRISEELQREKMAVKPPYKQPPTVKVCPSCNQQKVREYEIEYGLLLRECTACWWSEIIDIDRSINNGL